VPSGHRETPTVPQQVTYHGRPLYLFNQDAYVGGASPVGTQGIYGAGAVTPSGVSNTIPPLP
jgi:predicted lipoprotein with Yx(FWY)xxD motif